MSELNGTGVEYPTIELGGVTYTLKFTRGAIMYRLQKTGGSLAGLSDPSKAFAATIDVLHAALFGQFSGSPEELAELVTDEGKVREARQAVDVALGKVFPSTKMAEPATGARPPVN